MDNKKKQIGLFVPLFMLFCLIFLGGYSSVEASPTSEYFHISSGDAYEIANSIGISYSDTTNYDTFANLFNQWLDDSFSNGTLTSAHDEYIIFFPHANYYTYLSWCVFNSYNGIQVISGEKYMSLERMLNSNTKIRQFLDFNEAGTRIEIVSGDTRVYFYDRPGGRITSGDAWSNLTIFNSSGEIFFDDGTGNTGIPHYVYNNDKIIVYQITGLTPSYRVEFIGRTEETGTTSFWITRKVSWQDVPMPTPTPVPTATPTPTFDDEVLNGLDDINNSLTYTPSGDDFQFFNSGDLVNAVGITIDEDENVGRMNNFWFAMTNGLITALTSDVRYISFQFLTKTVTFDNQAYDITIVDLKNFVQLVTIVAFVLVEYKTLRKLANMFKSGIFSQIFNMYSRIDISDLF